MTTDNSTETPTTAAARAQFEAFQAETKSLTLKQISDELGAGLWEVAQITTATGECEDPYVVRHGWTLKGLRWHLAVQRYLETLLPPEDGKGDDTGSTTAPANRPSDPAATHAHLKKGDHRMSDLQVLLRTLQRSAQKELLEPGDAGSFCGDVLTLTEMAGTIAEEVSNEIDSAGLALYYRG